MIAVGGAAAATGGVLTVGDLLVGDRLMGHGSGSACVAPVGNDPPVAMPMPATVPGPSYFPRVAPATPRIVTGPFETITESLFGTPDPNTWRPLPLSSLFSEGWDEAWVPSPNGSSGAPRQGWINAMDGNLYRLG